MFLPPIDLLFEVAYLARREFVIKDDYVYRLLAISCWLLAFFFERSGLFSFYYKPPYLLQFAFADVGRGVGSIEPLGEAFNGHYAVRVGQKSQLVEVLVRTLLRLVRRDESDQHRMFNIGFDFDHLALALALALAVRTPLSARCVRLLRPRNTLFSQSLLYGQ